MSVYQKPPKHFNPTVEAVSCFLEAEGKALFLRRKDGVFQGSRWGMPGGKVDPGEALQAAIARELQEETGISVPVEVIGYFQKTYVRYPEFDFIFHMFQVQLPKKPRVVLSDEHQDYCWVSAQDALELDLISGNDECINLFYGTAKQ
ncbi:MAG: NUDIX hydrolase [Candidatus Spechtbacterales bacterium]